MTPQQVKFTRISGKTDKISTIDFNGHIEMMLRDFLRYPSVFKKSVRGKMFLFYRNLKLCPRENFIKLSLGPKNSLFEVDFNGQLSIVLILSKSQTLSPGKFHKNAP